MGVFVVNLHSAMGASGETEGGTSLREDEVQLETVHAVKQGRILEEESQLGSAPGKVLDIQLESDPSAKEASPLTVTKPKAAVKRGKPTRIVMGGVAKDIKPAQIGYIVPKMRRLLEALTPSWHVLVYENDSEPASREAWRKQFEALGENGTYVFKDDIASAGSGRTGRLSFARQEFLRLARGLEAEVMIVTDVDGVCGGKNEKLSYNATWFRDMIFNHAGEWEALSALVAEGYWDRWAFRHEEAMPFNMYGQRAGDNKIANPQHMQKWIDKQTPYSFIPVHSAFMMMSMYKLDATKGCKYSPTDENGDNDCEHVAFHRCMREQNDARVRIYTANYCDEGCRR